MTEHKVHCIYCGRLLSTINITTAENSHAAQLDLMMVCDSPGNCGKVTSLLLSSQDFIEPKAPPVISNCPRCGGNMRDNSCAACNAVEIAETAILNATFSTTIPEYNVTGNTLQLRMDG